MLMGNSHWKGKHLRAVAYLQMKVLKPAEVIGVGQAMHQMREDCTVGAKPLPGASCQPNVNKI